MNGIDLLEQKVRELISVVQRLNGENQALRAQLQAATGKLTHLSDEREVLDQERDVVRNRIEQLLGDLEGVTETSNEPQATPANQTETMSPLMALNGGLGNMQPSATAEAQQTELPSASNVNPILPGLS